MNYIVSSRIDFGGVKKICFRCKHDVYPLDKTMKEAKGKKMTFLCFECFADFYDEKSHVLVPTRDACERFGMSRADLAEVTKVMVKTSKTRAADENLAC